MVATGCLLTACAGPARVAAGHQRRHSGSLPAATPTTTAAPGATAPANGSSGAGASGTTGGRPPTSSGGGASGSGVTSPAQGTTPGASGSGGNPGAPTASSPSSSPKATVPGAASTPHVTTRRQYQPWAAGGSLAAGVAVASHESGGDCWTASIGDPDNPDAWRCMAGNGILDPCFAPPGQAVVPEVACATSPDAAVVLLDLTVPLSSAAAPSGSSALVLPWVMELADGDQCTLDQGTGEVVDGTVMDYACTGGAATYPDTTSEPWTVLVAAGDGATQSSQAVEVAWQ